MFSVGKAIEAIEYESNHPTSTTSKKICPYFFDNVKEENMISLSLLLLLEFPFVQLDWRNQPQHPRYPGMGFLSIH